MTPGAYRLPPQPGELVDRDRLLRFTWNGRRHVGFAGDTISSALAADGVRVLSRSFKYHRPRGILTASFVDPGATVQVGDEPNVRASHRRLAAGMRVGQQSSWPSLRYDVGTANQLVGHFLTAGFYYKTFIKPQRLWPAYEQVLQRFASGGRLSARSEHAYYDKRYAHPDVLVAGGGPAGMAVALAAADAGASVLLVEEEYELGGSLRWGGPEELATLADLRAAVLAAPNIEVLVDSVVAGRYDDNWVSVLQRGLPHVEERLVKARARILVVAAGLVERPYVFAGNDLPGVMLGTAVRRLVNLYAVRPGTRAVVLTANDEGDAAAADLERVGVELAAIVDARRGEGIRRALGRSGVRGAIIGARRSAGRVGARARPSGTTADGRRAEVRGGPGKGEVTAVELDDGRVLECDLLVTSTGWTTPTSLLNMAGDRPRYDAAAARFRPSDDLPDNVLAAGGIVGDGTVDEIVAHGLAVGAAAAARAGFGAATAPPPLPARPHPALFRASTHGMVDFSEDVSSKDIVGAAREGYDSSELVKRYTTATMGPSQGKLETVNTIAVLAEATGSTIAELGTTVWRPPYAPISLGALAGRSFEPIRHSPMQGWHEAHGAAPLVAGQWIRPDHYGDAAAEARTVRQRVGIIDVTPLGKLSLHGPDVPKLLNAVYVNKWSKLEVGSVRYGVMCGEDGVVMDDGVTGRLDVDRYLMSTTSSGAAAVWEHLESWLQTEHPEWQVHVTPLTTYYASINVAGPRSRELLFRVTEGVDLSADAFPYMRVRTGRVAGVEDCLMWRIGFTGELSYELHVPASYGLHVWETLLDRGRDLGVGAFGVEAQRILRLEKGHLIVSQDTDGLTNAYDAGLDALVKLDKDDFMGRPELAWARERGSTQRLVALQPLTASVLPPEASQIVHGDKEIVGRITSSRMSPALGRSVCLGYVSAELAEPGTVVAVQLPDGGRIGATVMPQLAHVDPDGTRLHADTPLSAPPTRAAVGAAPNVGADDTADGADALSSSGADSHGRRGSGAPANDPIARSPIRPTAPVELQSGWKVSTLQSHSPLRLADHTPLAKVLVRATPDGALADRLDAPFGRARRDEFGTLVVGSGPDEWLLLAAPWTAAEVVDGVASDTDGFVTVLDVTHGRALMRLTGAAAPQTLNKLCAIDLSDRVSPNGAAFRSSVAQLATDVVRDDLDGVRSYLLHCERSSGQYLFDVLLEAGREFGIEPDGFA